MFYGHWIECLRLPLSGIDVQAELSSMTGNTNRSNPSAATATSHVTPNSLRTTSCGQQVRTSIGGLNHKIRSRNPNHPVLQRTSYESSPLQPAPFARVSPPSSMFNAQNVIPPSTGDGPAQPQQYRQRRTRISSESIPASNLTTTYSDQAYGDAFSSDRPSLPFYSTSFQNHMKQLGKLAALYTNICKVRRRLTSGV